MKKSIVFRTVAIIIAVLTVIIIPKNTVVNAKESVKGDERAYLLMDFDSGSVIQSNNETKRLPIASMVKITTLSLVFDAINEGKIALDDNVVVSEYAFSMGGSQAFLDNGGTYSVEELIKSVIVASANDSCVALAEHIEGSVDGFVAKMNEKAKQLGMNDTNYVNCTGLPAQGGYSSAKDVGIITKYLMKNSKFFEYSKIWMYDIEHAGGRTTSLTNTNKLVRFFNGMDGGKTGYTDEALSCLSCRATRGDTSLVCVVIGASSSKTRNARVSELLNYGFSNYESKVIASKGDKVETEIEIKGGKQTVVSGEYANDIKIFGKKGEFSNLEKKEVVVKAEGEH